jgi:DnaA family protein
MDDKLKAKVLQHRARARGIELVLSVANYILTHSPKGRIDELFKLLNQLDEASIAAKRKITIPFVRQVLGW